MKISILVPSLNNVEYMKIVIPAFRKHTVNPYEILVHANNFSPEMKEYASKENFEVFEYSDKNDGVALSVNSLARQATGDIIFYIGDDVYVAPNWDVALVRKFNDNIFYQYLTPCMFGSRGTSPTKNYPIDYGRTPEAWREQDFLDEWWDRRIIKEDIVSGSGPVFVRKELWDKVGGFDEEYWPGFGTDPDLIAKIYFTAKKEGKPYEFRGVADSGVYHFQCISTEQILHDGTYRDRANMRFIKKWGMWPRKLSEIIGEGRKL